MNRKSMKNIAKKIISIFMKKKRQRYIKNLCNKGLKIGDNVQIVDSFFFDPSHCFLISIGDNCTICPNVRLIAHDASTKKKLGFTKIGRIDIGKNCFLGDSVIVLPNVKIGDNVIVGSGSVVTKDIPPSTVSAGNPARIICDVDSYLKKIRKICDNKKIFGKEYCIDVLTDVKKDEIINSIGKSIGFIV